MWPIGERILVLAVKCADPFEILSSRWRPMEPSKSLGLQLRRETNIQTVHLGAGRGAAVWSAPALGSPPD